MDKEWASPLQGIRDITPVDSDIMLCIAEQIELSADTQKWLNAATRGNLPIIETLLDDFGQDILHTTDNKQNTALHLAAKYGHAGIVQCLLKAGADPNQTGEDGKLPLDMAESAGNAEVIRMLSPFSYGVDIRIWDGMTG